MHKEEKQEKKRKARKERKEQTERIFDKNVVLEVVQSGDSCFHRVELISCVGGDHEEDGLHLRRHYGQVQLDDFIVAFLQPISF